MGLQASPRGDNQYQDTFDKVKSWFTQNKKIVYAAIAVFIFFVFLNPLMYVKVGHRGVVMRLGAVSGKILNEGINWVTPFYESVVQINVQIKKSVERSESASKDLQNVTTELALNYHVAPDSVNVLYQKIGLSYETAIIQPAVRETMKAITAQFTASELITKRDVVSMKIKESLKERLTSSYLIVDDVLMQDFDFSKSFNESIELKQKAEQDALKAKNDLERIKVEAEQKVAEARAEAESLRMKSQQLTPLMVKLEHIKAWKEGGSKVPTYVGCGKESFFMNMPSNAGHE